MRDAAARLGASDDLISKIRSLDDARLLGGFAAMHRGQVALVKEVGLALTELIAGGLAPSDADSLLKDIALQSEVRAGFSRVLYWSTKQELDRLRANVDNVVRDASLAVARLVPKSVDSRVVRALLTRLTTMQALRAEVLTFAEKVCFTRGLCTANDLRAYLFRLHPLCGCRQLCCAP